MGPYIASGSLEELKQARLRRKLETTIEADGASGYQLTALALENAPGLDAAAVRSAVGLASGNLDTQLAAIVEDTGATLPTILAAILDDTGTALPATLALIVEDTNTTIPSTLASILEDTGATLPASIAAIRSLLIDAQPIYVAPSVSPTGEITGPIVIGDDYLDVHGRVFSWTVPILAGVDIEDAEFWFGGEDVNGNSWLVEGSVAAIDGDADNWLVASELPKSATSGLPEGNYEYSGELRDESGNQVTRVRNNCDRKVKLVKKQSGGC